jgi:hypothetical protein
MNVPAQCKGERNKISMSNIFQRFAYMPNPVMNLNALYSHPVHNLSMMVLKFSFILFFIQVILRFTNYIKIAYDRHLRRLGIIIYEISKIRRYSLQRKCSDCPKSQNAQHFFSFLEFGHGPSHGLFIFRVNSARGVVWSRLCFANDLYCLYDMLMAV